MEQLVVRPPLGTVVRRNVVRTTTGTPTPGMHRRFRLTRSTDFQRVRRSGKSYAHPLAVLIVRPSENDTPRFGIAAGRALGKATQRNRAKRRLREALRPLLPRVSGGWDAVVIARAPVLDADFDDVARAVRQLLERAKLIAADS